MKYLLLFLLLSIISRCADDEFISPSWDYESFEAIKSAHPYQDVIPAYDIDYWELVWQELPDINHVHFSKGLICNDAKDPSICVEKYYELKNQPKNEMEFPFLEKGKYFLRTNEQGYNRSWNDLQEIESFLGSIDSKGDALLLASTKGYFFEKNNSFYGGIKKTDDGYKIIALKTISNCHPFQVDKFLIKIDKSGRISNLKSETAVYEPKACYD